MSDTAAHLFVLGIALLAVPLTALLGPWLTWFVGGFCIVAAIGVYLTDGESTPATESDLPARTNCPACGARTDSAADTCEHCGTSL